jgi:hypothetical protein
MAEITLTVVGLQELINKLGSVAGDELRTEIGGELYKFGEEVMTESKLVVPVLTGTLMNTGHVDPPVQSGASTSVILGYGGPAAPYALYVHEALEGATPPSPNWSWTKAVAAGKAIQWTRPGSGPKYLETPLKAKQHELPDRIRAVVMRALKKG